MSASTVGSASSSDEEEDMTTTTPETMSEKSEYSSDESSQTSCIDSDLQELYESFDVQDEAPARSVTLALKWFLSVLVFGDIALYPDA